jgi:hypothetical protein
MGVGGDVGILVYLTIMEVWGVLESHYGRIFLRIISVGN